MTTHDENRKFADLSNLWCADVVTFRDKREDDGPDDHVIVHSAMIDIEKPYTLKGVEDLPLISRWVEGQQFIGREDRDGTWRFFYGKGTKVVVIVQLHPWARFILADTTSVTESIVARDGEAFARISRWSLDEQFCKLEIIGGHRPNEESEDRSVMCFTQGEIRHLLAVLNNVLNREKFYYFDDPLWRNKLNAVAERNVGQTFGEWKQTLPTP